MRVVAAAPASPADRKRLIASIHASAIKLGMDTADKSPHSDYRAMLQATAGEASTTQMDIGGLRAVQRHLLKTLGAGKLKPKDGWHAEKMRALWAELGAMHALTEPSEEGLRRFVQAQTGMAALRFLSGRDGNRVVEALKAWVAREKAKK